METVLFLILTFTYARMAAAYEDNLLIPGYVELSHSTLSKVLICAHAPTRRKPNPGITRYRITYAGLLCYFVFFLCLFFCVKSGLAPADSSQIIASTVRKGGAVGVRLETEAQVHSSKIALAGLFANIAIWLLSTLGTRFSNAKSIGGRVMLILMNVAASTLLLWFCIVTIKEL